MCIVVHLNWCLNAIHMEIRILTSVFLLCIFIILILVAKMFGRLASALSEAFMDKFNDSPHRKNKTALI